MTAARSRRAVLVRLYAGGLMGLGVLGALGGALLVGAGLLLIRRAALQRP